MPHPNAWQVVCGKLVYFGNLAYCGTRIPGAKVPEEPKTKFTLPSYSIDMSGRSARNSPAQTPSAVPVPVPKRPHLRLV